MRLIAAVLASLTLTFSAAAQVDDQRDWAAEVQAAVTALQGGDFDVAAEGFSAAVLAARTPDEAAIALNGLATARANQAQFSEALDAANRALTLFDLEDERQLQLAVNTATLKFQVLQHLEDPAAQAALDQVVALKRRLPQPEWINRDDGAKVHQFTGFACPPVIAAMPLEEVTTYRVGAIDFSCSYDLGEEFNGHATVYFTRSPDSSVQHEIDAAVAAMMDRYGALERVADTPVSAVAAGQPVTVAGAILARGDSEFAGDRTGVWVADVGEWKLKVRLTWPSALSDEAALNFAAALFDIPTRDLWRDDCDRSRRTGRAQDALRKREMEAASGATVAALTLISYLAPNEAPRPATRTAAELERARGCFLGVLDSNGQPIIIWRPLDGDDVSHVASRLSPESRVPDYFAFQAPDLRRAMNMRLPGAFVAARADQQWWIIAALHRLPGDEQFLDIVRQHLAGELNAIVGVARTENGEYGIQLTEGTFGD